MRMTKLLPIAALALVPGHALAASEPSVACPYVATKSIPRETMVALIKGGFKPKSSKEKDAMVRLGEEVGTCRVRIHWDQARQDVAIRYLNGRVLREDALAQGQAVGLTPQIVDSIVTNLDEPSRTALATGKVTPAANALIAEQLKTSGIKFDTMTPEARKTLQGLVPQSVAATVLMQQSVTAYNR